MLSTETGSASLFIQVKELLVAKIGKGEWLPGAIIPGEIKPARELGVSQGTVLKATTELVETNVPTRNQGRGTFVSMHDPQTALFYFFHLLDDNGRKALPESRVLHCRRRRATRKEAAKLELEAAAEVIKIGRIALTLDRSPVELRISRCNTQNHHCHNTIF